MDQVTRPFEYEPLKPSYIRLLILHPGRGRQELYASLISVSIHEAPRYRYQALSYAWGEDKRKLHRLYLSPMRLDETRLPPESSQHTPDHLDITKSLFEALLQLRYAEKPRYLWVDAVCIQQSDREELKTQVRQMYAIYSKAEYTVVWLGARPNRHAFYYMLEVSEFFGTTSSLSIEPQEKPSSRNTAFHAFWCQEFASTQYPRIRDCKEKDFPLWHQNNLAAFLQLITEEDWFERAWIFQESVASKQKIIQQGSFVLPWTTFSNACKTLRNSQDIQSLPSTEQRWLKQRWARFMKQTPDHHPAISKPIQDLFPAQPIGPHRLHFQVFNIVQKMDDAISAIENPDQAFSRKTLMRPLLRHLLPTTRHMKSTEPRDKVFSLLNVDHEFRTREGSSGELVTHDRATSLCAAPHHNGGWSFAAAGKSQAAASISFVDAGHREKPILRACGVRFRRLEIVDVEVLPHNGEMVNGMLAGVKDRAYPGSNVSCQDAVNELADLVMAPYVDGAPYEPAKKHTHDRLLARVGKKMSGSKFDLSSLTSSSAYRDANGFTRKFFLSRSGYIGLAPLRAEKRDEICILFGAKTPMAIRDKGEFYEFIGECLILGVMQGELMKNLNGDYVENLEFR
ncbi:hypothetical protein SLS56_009208 [Neofusicoccum ribis]|uniref:Heterokaryon incompatibility domain-containing protein n=1 Tax=Neofusicoccum ribis TaxID=45134 RepID=A0ABR3SHX9_9PEZI